MRAEREREVGRGGRGPADEAQRAGARRLVVAQRGVDELEREGGGHTAGRRVQRSVGEREGWRDEGRGARGVEGGEALRAEARGVVQRPYDCGDGRRESGREEPVHG